MRWRWLASWAVSSRWADAMPIKEQADHPVARLASAGITSDSISMPVDVEEQGFEKLSALTFNQLAPSTTPRRDMDRCRTSHFTESSSARATAQGVGPGLKQLEFWTPLTLPLVSKHQAGAESP